MLTSVFVFLFLYITGCSGAKSCRLADVYKGDNNFHVPPECTKLALGGEKLGDEGVIALSQALTETTKANGLKNLAEVHLPTTGMGPLGADALATFLTSTGSGSSLRVLNLYGNQLGDAGAESLSKMFSGNNHAGIPLETLGIGVNNIGAMGAKALAKELGECSNCPLKTLGLYRNNVGDEGAIEMAKMVSKNVIALSSLFLGGNDVKNSGAVALGDALRTNTKLKVLSLEGGSVGNTGAMSLAQGLIISKTLIALDIRSCLPTHRNCFVGHLTTNDFKDSSTSSDSDSDSSDSSDPNKMSNQGLLALKNAVLLRFQDKDKPDLKVVGDINFAVE